VANKNDHLIITIDQTLDMKTNDRKETITLYVKFSKMNKDKKSHLHHYRNKTAIETEYLFCLYIFILAVYF